jgi:UDP-N-acetylmuramyl pentapeptide synthase
MIEIKLHELASVIEGRLIGDGEASVASTVETDSRLISSGSLFFASSTAALIVASICS